MQLSELIINGLVDDLSLRLGGALLKIYDGELSASFAEPLVVLKLRTPAFEPAVKGRAQALTVEPTRIARSGQAARAQLMTAAGQFVATLSIAEAGSEEARNADVVVDRLDFSRDGLLTIQGFSLRLPSTT